MSCAAGRDWVVKKQEKASGRTGENGEDGGCGMRQKLAPDRRQEVLRLW